jgi:hypothetical protein
VARKAVRKRARRKAAKKETPELPSIFNM